MQHVADRLAQKVRNPTNGSWWDFDFLCKASLTSLVAETALLKPQISERERTYNVQTTPDGYVYLRPSVPACGRGHPGASSTNVCLKHGVGCQRALALCAVPQLPAWA